MNSVIRCLYPHLPLPGQQQAQSLRARTYMETSAVHWSPIVFNIKNHYLEIEKIYLHLLSKHTHKQT